MNFEDLKERVRANRAMARYNFDHAWPQGDTMGRVLVYKGVHTEMEFAYPTELEKIRDQFRELFEKFWREQ
jgi:hypothetical protein